MKKAKILFFGNPLVKKDSLLHRIVGRLRIELPEVEFMEAEGSELQSCKELNILDVAEGIKDVVLINDLDKLSAERIYSLHDFDLSHNLKLMKKFGLIKKVNIIAIPVNFSEEDAVEGIKKVIPSLF